MAIANQTKSAQVNSFTGGINTDLHPMLQPNNTLTDCVNGTLITYDGNENMLQNDMGNYALEGAKLPPNYVPIGVKEYAGILYVVAYNPLAKRVQVGSYPSPKINNKPNGEGDGEVTIKPFKIASAQEGESLDIWEKMLGENKEEFPQLSGEYYLYSNVVKSTSQVLEILGDMKDSKLQLTINDQFKLDVTGNTDSEEWMQEIKFFSIALDGIVEDITECIKKLDNPNEEGFYNVTWQSAGWVGVKYQLAEVNKCKQVISDVKYPTYGRQSNLSWGNNTEDGTTTSEGYMANNYRFTEEPYVMIKEGNVYNKYYWNNITPNYSDTLICYTELEDYDPSNGDKSVEVTSKGG